MSMDRAKQIIKLFEKDSITVTAMGITNIRPLPKNQGIMFNVVGNRFKGLVKVRYDNLEDKYNIRYVPSGGGDVKEQMGINEYDLVETLSDNVGQSPLVLDFLIDMYLIK